MSRSDPPRHLPPAPAIVLAAAAAAWLAWLLLLPPRPPVWLVAGPGFLLGLALSVLLARRRGRPWIAFVRDTADVHVLGAVLIYALGVQWHAAHGITTDGVLYFSQLRSALFDNDLDLAREFAVLHQPPRPSQIVPIGPTLVWLPLYLAVAGIDALGRLLGAWAAPADPSLAGLTLPYIRAVLVSSFAVGAAGVVALHDHLGREFGRVPALAASLLLFWATPLFWYMVYEPSMTHAVSFGFVALLVVCSARWVPRGVTRREAVILGTLAGLAFLARPQEALFVLLPGCLVVTTAGRGTRERLDATWHLVWWAALGALPWLLLQAAHTTFLLSRENYTLVGDGGYLRPFDSHWMATLFSSWHGFLSWTPVAYVAVIGTAAYLRRNWRWAGTALVLLGMMAWVNGSTTDWAAGWSFGGRRFISMLAVLAPGLALAVQIAIRRPLILVAPAVAAAIVWNQLLMVQYTEGMVPKDAPVSFAELVRQQAEVYTRAPYFYPFAFPANAWFAWRQELPVDRYDLLAAEPLHASIDFAFDRDAGRFLLGGWSAPGADDWGPCWWIGGTPAGVTLPLALPDDAPISIEVTARTRADVPPVHARLAVEVNGTRVGELTATEDRPTVATIVVRAEGAPWRRGFNTIRLHALGVVPADPSDTRPPGPLARATGSRAWPVAVYRLRIAP